MQSTINAPRPCPLVESYEAFMELNAATFVLRISVRLFMLRELSFQKQRSRRGDTTRALPTRWSLQEPAFVAYFFFISTKKFPSVDGPPKFPPFPPTKMTPKNRDVRKAVAKLVAEVHKKVLKIAMYGRQWPNSLQKYTKKC